MAKKEAAERGEMLVAKDSFSVRYEGADHHFHAWETRVRAGHPILIGREHLFEPIQAHYDIEAATNNPGERRDDA